jgi:glycosyltransferase involved in cell wall biosynthesis
VDPRVVLVESETNSGPQSSRQRGLNRSDAELVAILDSDDWWHPDKLQTQADVLEDFDVVLCWHRWTHNNAVQSTRRPQGQGKFPPNLTTNMSTPLIRRRALDLAGGFLPPGTPSLRTAEGIEFYVRIAQHADYTVAPQVLADCLAHTGARSSSLHGTASAADDLAYTVETHRAFLNRWPHDYSVLLGRTAARYLEVGQTRRGLGYLRRSIAIGPGMRERRQLIRRFGPHAVKRLLLAAIGQ